MNNDRRTDQTLRKLVALGNHLCLWAGIPAKSQDNKEEIDELLDAWDKALQCLREQRKEIEHISL